VKTLARDYKDLHQVKIYITNPNPCIILGHVKKLEKESKEIRSVLSSGKTDQEEEKYNHTKFTRLMIPSF